MTMTNVVLVLWLALVMVRERPRQATYREIAAWFTIALAFVLALMAVTDRVLLAEFPSVHCSECYWGEGLSFVFLAFAVLIPLARVKWPTDWQ